MTFAQDMLNQLESIRNSLLSYTTEDIHSAADGRSYIEKVKDFRQFLEATDRMKGGGYPDLQKEILTVGENGVYTDELRFLFELIQNVDDCDFPEGEERALDILFRFNEDEIVLTYNESGFTPYNVFMITGIAERAKNIREGKEEIGEKGIGFKSVFGIAHRVRIRSGWFSFEFEREHFTIPNPAYLDEKYIKGTELTLYLNRGYAKRLYRLVADRYVKDATLFAENPLLFLKNLAHLCIHGTDSWRRMDFHVTRSAPRQGRTCFREDNVCILVDLNDYNNGPEKHIHRELKCARYSLPVQYSREAYQARYGKDTKLGTGAESLKTLFAVFPYPEELDKLPSTGALYVYLPTKQKLTVPLALHVPFRLVPSREKVDSSNSNLWFRESCSHLVKLLDYAYQDWSRIVREQIVHYLPDKHEHLFCTDQLSGNPLSSGEQLSCKHYLSLPIFAAGQNYYSIDDVFCMEEAKISAPQTVCRILALSEKRLFLVRSSDYERAKSLGIRVEKDIHRRILVRGLAYSELTSEALECLDRDGFGYSKELISELAEGKPNWEALSLTQAEAVFRCEKLALAMREYACERIRKGARPAFFARYGNPLMDITEVLGEEVRLTDLPDKVQKYLELCGKKCALWDTGETEFLPCKGFLVLSSRNPSKALETFCELIEPEDPFSLRIKFRKASLDLNRLCESDLPAEEFLRQLRRNRLMSQEAMGKKAYNRYLDLIVESGTTEQRFLQELLQNADDCSYPEGERPTFSIRQEKNTLIVSYNESGFSKKDVRAITAIGESTKEYLFGSASSPIGGKGIGFKTIFAVASEVRVFSGDFAFTLTGRRPTVPDPIDLAGGKSRKGTRLEIVLKPNKKFPSITNEYLRMLCLCLEKLEDVEIGEKKAHIRRESPCSIRIGTYSFRFERYEHAISVNDAPKGQRNPARASRIACLVPESRSGTYPLYTGLPTKHTIEIPMVIDAPFELNTSREGIQEDRKSNIIVRNEIYSAILAVMEARKKTERAEIFRFARFINQGFGSVPNFRNKLSSSDFLNDYAFSDLLRKAEILPTFDSEIFVSAESRTALLYPEVVNTLFRSGEFCGISPARALDIPEKPKNKDDRDYYHSMLNALGCKNATVEESLLILERTAETHIHEEPFRVSFYAWLGEVASKNENVRLRLRKLAIIPVYGASTGQTKFVAWDKEKVYVRPNTDSPKGVYRILNEDLLSKRDCEIILGVSIETMTAERELFDYNRNLSERICSMEPEMLYAFLIREYESGALASNQATQTLQNQRRLIPLKNQKGELLTYELFFNGMPEGYYSSEGICRLSINAECIGLAHMIGCRELNDIRYSDIVRPDKLTQDDYEAFAEGYFKHGDEILIELYCNGFLSAQTLEELGKDYLLLGRTEERLEYGEVPEDPVQDMARLKRFARKQYGEAPEIYSKPVTRSVQHIRVGSREFLLDSYTQNAREDMLVRYRPDESIPKCICQMCRVYKYPNLMEVRNLLKSPHSFFKSLRLCLCLDCGKRFESYRDGNNTELYDNFLEEIKNAELWNVGKITVSLGAEQISFTATHLAEIQEILHILDDGK